MRLLASHFLWPEQQCSLSTGQGSRGHSADVRPCVPGLAWVTHETMQMCPVTGLYPGGHSGDVTVAGGCQETAGKKNSYSVKAEGKERSG